MKNYKTEQEEFWASSEWASNYIKRNNTETIKNDIAFFCDIFKKCHTEIKSIIEFGSNIGINLHAIDKLFNHVQISAIEISDTAVEQLKKLAFINKIYHKSILDIDIKEQSDFVFIKGVLIHINPDYLDIVYKKLYDSSNKYIMIAEYYNPTPVSVIYRGNSDKLFKRDFAGEMLDKYSDLQLIDYKFVYHRDNNFPQDDITWFLLEKV